MKIIKEIGHNLQSVENYFRPRKNYLFNDCNPHSF